MTPSTNGESTKELIIPAMISMITWRTPVQKAIPISVGLKAEAFSRRSQP